MKLRLTIITFLVAIFTITAQTDLKNKVKVDGVAVVVGKNIVLDSDIDKFKKELAQRIEGKIDISDCEILEEVMLQKLLAHHAVIDSIEVSESRIQEAVNNNIQYFASQLGSVEAVTEYYGFDDEEDLRTELESIQREQLLIQGERTSITSELDVTPEEVRTYYKNLEKENNLPEFSAEVEFAQIVKFIKPSEAEVDRVINKLNEIKKDIEDGYSFRLKALINSDDPAAAGNGQGAGGKYTITRQSQFIREFKEVAFSLEEGEISEPFESAFGYHIILVEKVKGQERDVRHILIQPQISPAEMQAAKDELENIKSQIIEGEITFREAALKYSDDLDTKFNGGLVINGETNDTKFDLTRMQPELYRRLNVLQEGDYSEVFYEEPRGEEKNFKFYFVKTRTEAHPANFTEDYEKIQQLTLQKKQEETVDAWAEEKIDDTYIKLNGVHKKCEFKKNWKKQ